MPSEWMAIRWEDFIVLAVLCNALNFMLNVYTNYGFANAMYDVRTYIRPLGE